MTTDRKIRWRALVTLSVAGFLWSLAPEIPSRTPQAAADDRFIVQGSNTATVAEAVAAAGGEVTHELTIIKAVGARLTPAQRRRLEKRSELRIRPDRTTSVSGMPAGDNMDDHAWQRAEKEAVKIAAEWEKAAERAAKDAAKSAAKLELAGDRLARDEARQAERDARQWEETLKEWNKEWAKDAFLKDSKPTFFPTLVNAHALHTEQVTGAGVTIAIVDTGLWNDVGLRQTGRGERRVLATYDARVGEETTQTMSLSGEDANGHGSHIASVAASSRKVRGEYNGIAPDAHLVAVTAFDEEGVGSYADVIRGLGWILENQSRFNIRVVNLSFSAAPQSHYWDDPINQAVMRLWQAGIVVIASAGNTGPDAMTIGVPGNVPYIVTVGAMTDSYTPEDRGDDRLTWFSAAGPTHEGFVKPDLVAPGGHIRGVMPKQAYIPKTYPQFHDGKSYFAMSGTSQATAVVTGIVALMLQFDPDLTPDEVKFRLQAASRPAVDGEGHLTFSVFQQGAGLVDAWRAVFPQVEGEANQGLDLAADIAGTQHYRGRANRDAEGNYYIEGLDGFMWNNGFMWNDGFMWNNGFMWNDGLTETMAINTWVGQQ